MTRENTLPLVAVTMGDPVGIGPEIIAKSFANPNVYQWCRPVVYGNTDRLKAGVASTIAPIKIHGIPSIDDGAFQHGRIDVIDPAPMDASDMAWGTPSSETGTAMVEYLKAAIDDAIAGRVAAIATSPINKQAMTMAGIHFSGHTEILAHRTGTRDYAMMLAGSRLKVVLVTIHIPIDQVPRSITSNGILKIVTLTCHALKTRFGSPTPRIAVAGLNPHAGESGLFGIEEQEIIAPAIRQAVSRGINASGPHPPDTVFFSAAQGTYDAVVAMYHDQGLGPFKMIHFDDGVNTTLGLPIIRTSVDHGTAYDIAGSGTASPESLLAAIKMAADQAGRMHRTRDP